MSNSSRLKLIILLIFLVTIFIFILNIRPVIDKVVTKVLNVSLFGVPSRDVRARINRGKMYARRQNVAIVGLTRDCETSLERAYKITNTLAEYFNDYRIYFVENDSTDSTRQMLLRWAAVDPKFAVLGCGVNAEYCNMNTLATGKEHSSYRLTKMARLRNIYIDWLGVCNYTPDILIVIDPDIKGKLFMDGVFESVAYVNEGNYGNSVEAVTANGFKRQTGLYYDVLAHCEIDETPHRNGLEYDANGLFDRVYRMNDPLRRIRSGFGGISVYNYHAVVNKGARYFSAKNLLGENDDTSICEHYFFNEPLECYLNPNMMYCIDTH